MWHHAGSVVRLGSGCWAKEVIHTEKKLGWLCVSVCVGLWGWGCGVVGVDLLLVDEDIKAYDLFDFTYLH